LLSKNQSINQLNSDRSYSWAIVVVIVVVIIW